MIRRRDEQQRQRVHPHMQPPCGGDPARARRHRRQHDPAESRHRDGGDRPARRRRVEMQRAEKERRGDRPGPGRPEAGGELLEEVAAKNSLLRPRLDQEEDQRDRQPRRPAADMAHRSVDGRHGQANRHGRQPEPGGDGEADDEEAEGRVLCRWKERHQPPSVQDNHRDPERRPPENECGEGEDRTLAGRKVARDPGGVPARRELRQRKPDQHAAAQHEQHEQDQRRRNAPERGALRCRGRIGGQPVAVAEKELHNASDHPAEI